MKKKTPQHSLGYAVKDRSGAGRPEKKVLFNQFASIHSLPSRRYKVIKTTPGKKKQRCTRKEKEKKKVTLDEKKVNHTLKI